MNSYIFLNIALFLIIASSLIFIIIKPFYFGSIIKVLDKPDNSKLKIHKDPIPKNGGFIILLFILLYFIINEFFNFDEFNLNNKQIKFGALVCYEDFFPQLARKAVVAGSDILFVATNDTWYGEEGAAYFHAAHSILRAVENRRPVIRSGNAGWSGWIDPLGKVRECLVDDTNSIYFKGGGVMELKLNPEFSSKISFYVKYGDWFVLLSGAMTALISGGLLLKKTRGL